MAIRRPSTSFSPSHPLTPSPSHPLTLSPSHPLKTLAEDEGVPYFEASAKANTNVEAMFMQLATTIVDRKNGVAGGAGGAAAASGTAAGGLANPANIALGGGDKKSGPPCC